MSEEEAPEGESGQSARDEAGLPVLNAYGRAVGVVAACRVYPPWTATSRRHKTGLTHHSTFHARNELAVFVCMDTLISNADDAKLDETCARCCQDFARKKTHKIRSAGLEVDEAVSELVQHFLPQARSRTTTGEVERLIYGNAGLVLSRLLGNTSPMGPRRRSVKGPSKRPSKESSRGRQNEDTQLTGGRNRRSTIRCVSSRGLSDRADQTAGAVERVDARDAVTAAIDSLKKRIPRTGWIVEQFMLQEAGMAAGDWRRRAAEKYGITVRRAYQLKDEGVTLLRHYC